MYNYNYSLHKELKYFHSQNWACCLIPVAYFTAELKEKLKTELVNELKFNEIKIITSIPKIEEYMKELIKKSNKEDKEPAEEYELIQNWAEDLKLEKFFELQNIAHGIKQRLSD